MTAQEIRLLAAALPCPTGIACTGCRYCENARERLEATVECHYDDPRASLSPPYGRCDCGCGRFR